jgi:hypothetical protein
MNNLVLQINIKNPIDTHKILNFIENEISDFNHRVNYLVNYKEKKIIFNFYTFLPSIVLGIKLEKNLQIFENNYVEVFDTKFLNTKILNKKNTKIYYEKNFLISEPKNFFDLSYSEKELQIKQDCHFIRENTNLFGFNENTKNNINDTCDNIGKTISKILIDDSHTFFDKVKSFINCKKETNNHGIFIYNLDDILEKISKNGIKTLTDNEINFLKNYSDTI